MRRLFTLFVSLAAAVASYAQLNGEGFYRVYNADTYRYAYVTNNKCNGINAATQTADLSSIELLQDCDSYPINSAIPSVIYVSQHGNQYDLEAQGTGVHEMIDYYVSVVEYPAGSGRYRTFATYSGVTLYLGDKWDADEGTSGTLTTEKGSHKDWNILPVAANSDNYLGVLPTVTAAGKHYRTYYVDFAFSTYSSGMKVYNVRQYDAERGLAVIVPVEGMVPANTAVIIECSSQAASDNRLELSHSSASPLETVLDAVYFDRRNGSATNQKVYDENTMRVLGIDAEGRLAFVKGDESNLNKSTRNKATDNDGLGLATGTRYASIPANTAYLTVAEGAADAIRIVTETEYAEILANEEQENQPVCYLLTYYVDADVYRQDSVEAGSAITPLEAPSKEGFTFSGWSEIPETMPEHDVTVYGTFSVNSYVLTYYVDGEVYKTETLEYGAVIVPEAVPTKEGYTFSGWSDVPETMPAHDVTVNGTFSVNSYVLTYYVDGEVYKSDTLEYGASIVPEADPEKEGFTFSGWSDIPETMPAYDVTVNGSFTIIVYAVTIEHNDGGTVVASAETVEYGGNVTITVVPDEGYEIYSVMLNGRDASDLPWGFMGITISDVRSDVNVNVMFSEVAGISHVGAADMNGGQNYDLYGRKVQNPVNGGIYIRSGRKYINK